MLVQGGILDGEGGGGRGRGRRGSMLVAVAVVVVVMVRGIILLTCWWRFWGYTEQRSDENFIKR